MGMDFVALMKYGGPDERLARVLDRLELQSPEELQAVRRLMQEQGYFHHLGEKAVWEYGDRPELRNPRLDHRPRLPNMDVRLRLPENFFLTFGPDAIEVYHLLRWRFFLTEPDFQQAMLAACTCLCRLFGATDCILTSDFNAAVGAFRKGAGFVAALQSAEPQYGERPNLADLYLEYPEDLVMRTIHRPDGSVRTQEKEWPRDEPPPSGWERICTWDSLGYWRLPLITGGSELAADRLTREWMNTPLPEGYQRGVADSMDEQRWAISNDLDAMLDYVLKPDEVNWRKVWLWGCACVRRLWLRLEKEPARKIVEVIEQFADGQADQQAVDRAAEEACRVRRGDRWANNAACQLGQFCSSAHRVPPGNISRAVADAVVKDAYDSAAWASEVQEHVNLLRDIFGPQPLRPLTIKPNWRTPTTIALAQTMYDKRSFADMPILADALEEAGCTSDEILTHCRDTNGHVRGCWVVDLILAKA